jgi:transposase-like protein
MGNPIGLALNAICGRCRQPAKIIEIRITPHIIESKYRCFNCSKNYHLEFNARIGQGSLDLDSSHEV